MQNGLSLPSRFQLSELFGQASQPTNQQTSLPASHLPVTSVHACQYIKIIVVIVFISNDIKAVKIKTTTTSALTLTYCESRDVISLSLFLSLTLSFTHSFNGRKIRTYRMDRWTEAIQI